MSRASYAIALGSNRPHHHHGGPRRVLAAALKALDGHGLHLSACSPILATPPIGPSRRTFANAAALIETGLTPPELLRRLKRIERDFGRRNGQRWGERTLDLDIILWSGGAWRGRHITVPHLAFRQRAFVLNPLASIAPHWRDPHSALTVRQLLARLKKPKPVDPGPKPD